MLLLLLLLLLAAEKFSQHCDSLLHPQVLAFMPMVGTFQLLHICLMCAFCHNAGPQVTAVAPATEPAPAATVLLPIMLPGTSAHGVSS